MQEMNPQNFPQGEFPQTAAKEPPKPRKFPTDIVKILYVSILVLLVVTPVVYERRMEQLYGVDGASRADFTHRQRLATSPIKPQVKVKVKSNQELHPRPATVAGNSRHRGEFAQRPRTVHGRTLTKLFPVADDESQRRQEQNWIKSDYFVHACAKNRVNKVRRLIEEIQSDPESDVAVFNQKHSLLGYTALHAASDHGHLEVVQLLLNIENINVNVQRKGDLDTPLHWAAQSNRIECIEALLNAGANKYIRNARGFTPLDVAMEFQTELAVCLLIDVPTQVLPVTVVQVMGLDVSLSVDTEVTSLGSQVDLFEVEVVAVAVAEAQQLQRRTVLLRTEDSVGGRLQTVFRDLLADQTYRCVVRAHNTAGWSSYSAAVEVRTLFPVPRAMEAPRRHGPVALHWHVPPPFGLDYGVDRFRLEFLETAEGDTATGTERCWRTASDAIPAETAAVSEPLVAFHFREMRVGCAYCFRLTAHNASGWGAVGAESLPFLADDAPRLVSETPTSLRVTWSTWHCPQAAYDVFLRVRAGQWQLVQSAVSGGALEVGATRAVTSDTWRSACFRPVPQELLPWSEYQVRLRRVGDVGSSVPSELVRTLAAVPFVPSAPTLAERLQEGLVLEWEVDALNCEAAADSDVYCQLRVQPVGDVYWAAQRTHFAGGLPAKKAVPDRWLVLHRKLPLQHPLPQQRHTVTDLPSGYFFRFAVRVHNARGYSPWSQASAVWAPASAVPRLVGVPEVLSLTTHNLVLKYEAPLHHGAPLLRKRIYFRPHQDEQQDAAAIALVARHAEQTTVDADGLVWLWQEEEVGVQENIEHRPDFDNATERHRSVTQELNRLPSGIRFVLYVAVSNSVGWSAPSQHLSGVFTKDNPPATPEAPELQHVFSDALCISWHAPISNCRSKHIEEYRVQYREDCQYASDEADDTSWRTYVVTADGAELVAAAVSSDSSDAEVAQFTPKPASMRHASVSMSVRRPSMRVRRSRSVEMRHSDVAASRRAVPTQLRIPDLLVSVQYQVRLCAKNNIDFSGYSRVARFMTRPTEPAVTLPPVSFAFTTTSCTLKWLPPHDNGKRITKYEIKIAPTNRSLFRDRYPLVIEVAAGDLAPPQGDFLTHGLADLIPGVDYQFAVRAANEIGWASWSCLSASSATVCTPPVAPDSPRVRSLAPTQLLLEWPVPFDSGDVVLRYELQVFPSSGHEQVERISPNALLWFEEEEADQVQVAYSGSDDAQVAPGMLPPSVFNREAEIRGEMDASYRLHMHDHDKPWRTVSNDVAHDVEHQVQCCVVRHLYPTTAYHFRLRASNSQGWSPFSTSRMSEPCTTPSALPCMPSSPQLVHRTDSILIVRWDDPVYNNGAAVVEYRLQIKREAVKPTPAANSNFNLEMSQNFSAKSQNASALAFQCDEWTTVPNPEAADLRVTERTHLAQHLLPVTSYRFRVRCRSHHGWSRWSIESDIMTTKRRF